MGNDMPDQKTAGNLLCSAGNSCLLIIDIQSRLTAAMPGKVLERLKRNTTLLIKAANLLQLPVFATRQYPAGLGPMEADIQAVLPKDCRHFDKTCFSCSDANGFMDALAATGKQQIIITGIEAHICVLQTAIALHAAGYDVFVVGDAVSSRQRENYENAIQRLQSSAVCISSTESVLFEWLRDASHPQFKDISTLVK
jgi:nicotinamidase-related amidase